MKSKSLVLLAGLVLAPLIVHARVNKAEEQSAIAYKSGYEQGQLDMKQQAQEMVNKVIRDCQNQVVELKRQFEEQNQRANLLQMQKTDLEIENKKLKAR